MTIERILDIAGEGRHLSLTRGFLAVSHDREELGRVPLDDIVAVIVHGFGTTLSANLLADLAERHVFLVLCDQSHNPRACMWPLSGHHAQGARMRGQIAAALGQAIAFMRSRSNRSERFKMTDNIEAIAFMRSRSNRSLP